MRKHYSAPRAVAVLRPLAACLAIALSLKTQAASTFPDVSATGSGTPIQAAPDSPTSIFLVENCDDAGQGSLRDAVNSANITGVDATIKFDLNAMGCSTISLTTGEMAVTINNLTIQGPDPDVVIIEGGYSQGHYNRIFKHVTPIGILHLDHLVLTDAKYLASGNQPARGGCVYSSSMAYLSNTRVDGCHAFSQSGYVKGGGVFGRGVKLVDALVTNCNATSQLNSSAGGGVASGGNGFSAKDSTLSDNAADSFAQNPSSVGGGSYSQGGAVTFERSTISGNTARRGGGLVSTYPVALANTTIANNIVEQDFGAIWVQDALSMYNSTVAFNVVNAYGVSGGVEANSIYAVSSLLARNVTHSGSGLIESDARSSDGHISGSHDLIMVTENGTTPPMDTLTACPRLAPLLDNGGLTRTVALLPGSPAIDSGYDPFALGTDQRGAGFDRVIGANADIGAYEWSGGSGDEINRSGFESCE